jgi:DNA (cytosine-5)-methyltransferase 1
MNIWPDGLTVLELCTGGGGQALGLERAGFTPVYSAEIDPDCCRTLRANRPDWPVAQDDIARLAAEALRPMAHAYPASLVAGGLPCTPHTRGGRQLGAADERHLWDAALAIIGAVLPPAVMLETSNAIFSPQFDDERSRTLAVLWDLGYQTTWDIIDASWYGVPQRRRRAVLVALDDRAGAFSWPQGDPHPPSEVGSALYPLARAGGWAGAAAWAAGARDLAPVVTGGSRKHGGPDLGASQGKAAWRKLGIDPMGIASSAPDREGKYLRSPGIIRDVADGGLMLTVEMAARLQGFPSDWIFCGGKTSQYRQVGNAFPPPAAAAIGRAIRAALEAAP